MSNLPTHHPVDILLSTYNGEKFLPDLIKSIIKQTYSNWNIMIRDDSSTDTTLAIIEDYCSKHSRIHLTNSSCDNLGPSQSFNELLKVTSSPYIMFCDQDDIWHNHKIEVMLKHVIAAEKSFPTSPILVVSDLNVVDEKANLIAPSFWNMQRLSPLRGCLFPSMLIQNKFPGCSMLFNRRLKEVIGNIPKQATMHDWWTALVASAFGKIIIINEPLTLYRQHQSNTIGAQQSSAFQSLAKSFARIISLNPIAISNLKNLNELPEVSAAQVFLKQYRALLSEQQLSIINDLSTYSILKAINRGIFRQPASANIPLYLAFGLIKLRRLRILPHA